MLKSINAEQRLYVLTCGDGYSCLGFDVMEGRIERARAWLDNNHAPVSWAADAPAGTPERFEQYEATMAAVRELAANPLVGKCTAELSPQLIGYEGKRVEVVDCYGERRRFIVGKSTGFIPIHLEIARRNSSGGPAVSGTPFRSVRLV